MPDKPPVSERHVKQLAKLERALHLRGWALALDALDLARELEAGKLRKDGKTPKFHHHVSVARLVYTLAPHLQFPERTVAAAFLHDLLEDHGDIIHADLDDRFGTTLANDVELLTKKTMGLAKTYEVYFEGMATSPVASVGGRDQFVSRMFRSKLSVRPSWLMSAGLASQIQLRSSIARSALSTF